MVAMLCFAVALLANRGIAFGSDQALFLDYAAALRAGGVLYVDVWDNKQPGIFWLYALANLAFGEGWHAIRIGYALWLGATGAVAAALLRLARPAATAWLWAPALTVGLLSLRTDALHAAQIEVLTGLPLGTILLLCMIEPSSPRWRLLRWLAIGAVAASVAVLKLVLVPVAAAIVVCGLGWRIARNELALGDSVRASVAMFAGAALVLAPVVVHFASRGAMTEFAWTTFDYPRQAVGQVETQRVAILGYALKWLLATTAGLLPAVLLAVGYGRKQLRTRSGLLLAGCLAWAGSALVMILLQKFSWWTYHMDMVVWPIGLLAALGLAGPADGDATSRRLAGTATVLVAAFLAVHLAWFASKVIASPDWPRAAKSAAALQTAARVAASARTPCNAIYAIGDYAGVVSTTGLRQALPTQGVFPMGWLPAQLDRLPDELAMVRPDLVYVDGFARERLGRTHPAFFARVDDWLASAYRHVATDALGGAWWERFGTPRDGTCPASPKFAIPGRPPGRGR